MAQARAAASCPPAPTRRAKTAGTLPAWQLVPPRYPPGDATHGCRRSPALQPCERREGMAGVVPEGDMTPRTWA